MLGCQSCGGSGAAAPVSDVMLRSSFSALLPPSVEDAAATAAALGKRFTRSAG